jgi:hypothetical protein
VQGRQRRRRSERARSHKALARAFDSHRRHSFSPVRLHDGELHLRPGSRWAACFGNRTTAGFDSRGADQAGRERLVTPAVPQTVSAEFDPLAPHRYPPVPPVEGARLIRARARCDSERADERQRTQRSGDQRALIRLEAWFDSRCVHDTHEWRNRQTPRSQKPVTLTGRAGSIPVSCTSSRHGGTAYAAG